MIMSAADDVEVTSQFMLTLKAMTANDDDHVDDDQVVDKTMTSPPIRRHTDTTTCHRDDTTRK